MNAANADVGTYSGPKSRQVLYSEAMDRRIRSGLKVLPADSLVQAKSRNGIRVNDNSFDGEIEKLIAAQEKTKLKAKPAPVLPEVVKKVIEVTQSTVVEVDDDEGSNGKKKHRPRGKGKNK